MASSLRTMSLRRVSSTILSSRAAYLKQLRPANALYRNFSSSLIRQKELGYLVGTKAALQAANDPSFTPSPTLFEKEFSMKGRVVAVSGANRGLGLETALALAEAGATVHCFDLASTPSDIFSASSAYLKRLGPQVGRIEYSTLDVTNQDTVWSTVEKIAEREGGKLDACIAAAGIFNGEPILEYKAEDLKKIVDVNLNGVLFFAQACGRVMDKAGNGGSIILLASAGGTNAIRVRQVGVFYISLYTNVTYFYCRLSGNARNSL